VAAETTAGGDAVAFLIDQHRQIKSLFAEVVDARGEERRERFTALRRLLAAHETAEEEIVHPRARRELCDGDDVIGALLQEENEAKEKLTVLEGLDVDSSEFEKLFLELQGDVLLHASAEEEQEFARLSGELDPEESARMHAAVQLAESLAPTRPHPGVESATANLMAGPFAAMLDRVRDVVSGKS
jgi:hypothetical protein